LSKRSVPQGTDGAPISVADSGFCEELAQYLGIKPSTAKTAFLDEPAQRVLGVASWAMDKSEDHEERARTVIGGPRNAERAPSGPSKANSSRWPAASDVARRPTTARARRSQGSWPGTGTRTRGALPGYSMSWRSG
jgi:hypothetical protein